MKILFATHWANNMLIFRTWMLQEAVRRGYEVIVLCPPDAESKQFREMGCRHISWKLQRGGGIRNLWSAIIQARQVLQQEKPDSTVVYCVQPILAMLFAWKFSKAQGSLFPTFTGLGSLWTDLEPASLQKKGMRWIVERGLGRLLPQSKAVFVLNLDDKTQVASWSPKLQSIPGVLGKDFTTIPEMQGDRKTPVVQTLGEGVDLSFFQIPTHEYRVQARERWNIPQHAFVIGYVGRLIREKGAQAFLKFCREMAERSEVHFLVVGDPDIGNPSSLTLQEMTELESVPRLHRESWMQDVRPAYAAMDALLFFSVREGFPVTPIEAMACGVPVYALDAIGTREVIPKEWIVKAETWNRIPNVKEDSFSVRVRIQSLDRKKVQENLLECLKSSQNEPIC